MFFVKRAGSRRHLQPASAVFVKNLRQPHPIFTLRPDHSAGTERQEVIE